jgi:hypothetical protein
MLLFLAVFALMPGRSASAAMLSITPLTSTLQPGQSETISVTYTESSTNTQLIAATDLAIAYDSTRFSVSNVGLGTLDSAANGFAGTFNTNNLGEITSSISTGSLGTQTTVNEVGTLLTFTLTALTTAPNGAGTVILQQKSGNTTTDVFDGNTGSIVLVPAPTNTFNPVIDATVIVGSTAVPEPSSLVLMGLGGLIAGTTMLRKKARLARAR